MYFLKKKKIEKSKIFPPKAETNPTMICLQERDGEGGKRGKKFGNPLRAATSAALNWGVRCFVNFVPALKSSNSNV